MSYSALKIFNDSAANALVDRIYYEVGMAFPSLTVDSVFALSGRAAAQLQGAAAGDCNNIIFITSDAGLYAFFQTILPGILSARAVRFTERTIFYFDAAVIEVWHKATAIKLVTASGITLQDITEINPILL